MATPRILASLCFPQKPPSEQKIRSWLNELVREDMVGTYTAPEDGKKYLKLLNWGKCQQTRAKSSKYKKSYDLQSRAGFYNEIAKIDASAVEDAVSYPWSGAMFSDRLWQSKQALVFNTREIITQGLIQGKSVGVMASALSSRMGQSYKNAERLIRTETAHIHAEADRRAYKGSRRRGI